MKSMETLRDMLCDKLDEMVMTGELNAGSLEAVDKLTHAIKSIDTIMAMESASHYDGGYYDESPRHTGRYSNRMRGYSRNDMKEKVEDMLQDAHNPEVKDALRKVLRVMK